MLLDLTNDEVIALHRLLRDDYLYSFHKEAINKIKEKMEKVKMLDEAFKEIESIHPTKGAT